LQQLFNGGLENRCSGEAAVNLSVAPGLTDYPTGIEDLLIKIQPGIAVTSNCSSSGILQTQIENGKNRILPEGCMIFPFQNQTNSVLYQ
jgi:ABC-type molybdate transport system substrate-binding protein